MIVALIGCHGSGKTTLGRALAARLGWTFDGEIGGRLAADPRLRPSDATAADEQTAFDDAVFREELARDAVRDPRVHRLVETWHPGNLAYAAARSASVVQRSLPAVAASIARQPAAVIEVLAPDDVIARRKSEPGRLAFFLEIGAAARAWATRLGLPVIAHAFTHERSAGELADDIAGEVLAAARGVGAR